MKKVIVLVFALLYSITSIAQIEVSTIKNHIEYLSSKELNGRISGTEGGQKAAAYLANEWKNCELMAYHDSVDYFQVFTQRDKNFVKPCLFICDNDSLAVTHITKEKHYSDNRKLVINNKSSDNNLIEVEAKCFDDGIQSVLQMSNIKESDSYLILLSDKHPKKYTLSFRKFKKADNASAIRVMNDYGHFLYRSDDYIAYRKSFEHLNIFVAGTKAWETFKTDRVDVLVREVPDSIIYADYRNVISKIQGQNPNKGAIVICAHYDHVDSLYSRKTKNKPLLDYYPGADDNASGTAAVVELAKTLKNSDFMPEQTIYFCLFDAEEKGLYGSKHFADNIDEDVDMVINMDMVGRDKNDKKRFNDVVFCMSSGKKAKHFNKEFDRFVKGNSSTLKIKRFDWSMFWMLNYFPSDNLSFRPESETSCFHTGNHDDYHTPNDTADKINYDKLTEYINLMSVFLQQHQF